MYPYGLPPGALFVENFTSPATVAANGGVITGTGLANGRFMPTTTGQIEYPAIAASLARKSVLTVASVVDALAFTGVYRTLFYVRNAALAVAWQVGARNNANRLFWYSDTGIVYAPANFTVGKRSFIWVCDGTNVTFYQDGIALGAPAAGVTTRIAPTGLDAYIGNNGAGGLQPFGQSTRHLSVYNTAFDAASAKELHSSLMRQF